jgi:O-antigen ligase/tetratricopeptide (TPR) repeat protein
MLAEAAGGQRPGAGWQPLSADPEKTFHGALRLSLGLAAVMLAMLAVRDRRDRRFLVAALAASAVFQAVYGLAELLSGHEHIFHVPKEVHLGVATGTFVNPNHYGTLLSLGMFAVLGLLHDLWRHRDQEDPGRAPKASLAASAAALIVIALVWSASRGALTCAAGGLVIWSLLTLPRLASPGARRVATGLVASLVVILVGGAIWMRPPEPLIDDLARAGLSPENRFEMWGDGAGMVAAFPFAGTGLGTYGTVAELYRSPELNRRPIHAHSDYLEWCVELGVPGGALMIAALGVVAVCAWRLLRRRSERALSAALVAGLVALAAHEVVEFSLQLAGVAVPAALALGALLAPWARRAGGRGSGAGARRLLAATMVALIGSTLSTSAGSLLAARRAAPALDEPPRGFVMASTLRSWGRARVAEVLDRAERRAGRDEAREGASGEALVEQLGPPLLALQRAARAAPLRPEPRIGLWTASQALVAAHPERAELARRVTPLLEHYLRRAEELSPSDRERRLVLARYWMTLGNRDEAVRVVRDLLEMEPGRAREAYGLLGGEKLGLNELFAATPNEPDAAIRLASYLWRRKDRAGAQIVLERALSNAPDSWDLRRYLASRLLARNRDARALEVLEHEPAPEDTDLKLRVERLRARAHAGLGDLQALEGSLERLEALGASRAELELVRGRAAAGQGETDRAVASLREALQARRPSLGERQRLSALLTLGRLLQRDGDYPGALESYREARRIDPDHPAVTRFFERLERRRSR